MVKVGDLVKGRVWMSDREAVGVVTVIHTEREICGPNGDFFVQRWCSVLWNNKLYRAKEENLIVVSRS
jgi:hypothetical protein